jgi:hypothetical protein
MTKWILVLVLLVALPACLNDVTVTENGQLGSGEVELVAADPLRHTFDFVRGRYGSVIENGQVRNAGSHIDYANLIPDEFAVGVQGGERGIIVDLGPDAAVAGKLGVTETVGSGQGYAALALESGKFNDPDAAPVLGTPPSQLSMSTTGHARPFRGHVYALRVVRDGASDLVVKLLVVSVTDGQSVDFEWTRLR